MSAPKLLLSKTASLIQMTALIVLNVLMIFTLMALAHAHLVIEQIALSILTQGHARHVIRNTF